MVAGGEVGAFFLALVAFGPGLYGTVLIHEIGHMLVASRLGQAPEVILLWPLGGLAVIANYGASHMDQIKIALAGPMTHVANGVVSVASAGVARQHDMTQTL